METPPVFFYNPNAYALGIIQPRAIECVCCGQARAFSYEGNFYSTHKLTRPLCPWCIADGSAAAKFAGEFVANFDNIDPDPEHVSRPISPASSAAVSQRTPAYHSWQGVLWLTHCDEACVFLGYVGSAELQPIWEEVLPDITGSGWQADDVRRYLRKDGDLTGYLFQCPACGLHRVHLDAS